MTAAVRIKLAEIDDVIARVVAERVDLLVEAVAERIVAKLRAPRPRPPKSGQRAKPSAEAVARMARKLRVKGIR